jgi:hypothetical protein
VLARPVAGPYRLPEREYPFTIAAFVAADPDHLVWAQTVLRPQRGLLRMVPIPPVSTWVGEPVDAVILRPREWPDCWVACG